MDAGGSRPRDRRERETGADARDGAERGLPDMQSAGAQHPAQKRAEDGARQTESTGENPNPILGGNLDFERRAIERGGENL